MITGNNAKVAPIVISENVKNSVSDKRYLHIFHFNDTYNLDPAYVEEPIGIIILLNLIRLI